MSSALSTLRPTSSIDTSRRSLDVNSMSLSEHDGLLGGATKSLQQGSYEPSARPSAKLVPPFLKVDTPGGSFSGSFVRGPAVANIGKLRGTWQLAAVGKPAAAAVLTDLKVQKINSGGPEGIKAEAAKYIVQHSLDDTFYVIDLANVVRMHKASQSTG
eukprot:jgi/Chrzof1/10147/Cz04g30190.t1